MNLTEVEKWFEDLNNLILDLNISINNATYLLNVNSETKIVKHGFFQHHIYQLKFIIVIHLCKIFDNSNNQKRNINKLFNKLENEPYDLTFQQKLCKNSEYPTRLKNKNQIIDKIKTLREEISQENEFLKDLRIVRDQFYAHKDPDSIMQSIKWDKLNDLIKLAAKAYNQIYGGLCGS